jgi:hypothetical protein
MHLQNIADEKRFELLTPALTKKRSAVELFILFVGPVRLELTTPGVKDRYSTTY